MAMGPTNFPATVSPMMAGGGSAGPMSGLAPPMPPGGPPPQGALGGAPPQQGAPPPQGALSSPQAVIQARILRVAQEMGQLFQIIKQIPGLNQDQFMKGSQAIEIGVKMIAEAMPQQR